MSAVLVAQLLTVDRTTVYSAYYFNIEKIAFVVSPFESCSVGNVHFLSSGVVMKRYQSIWNLCRQGFLDIESFLDLGLF